MRSPINLGERMRDTRTCNGYITMEEFVMATTAGKNPRRSQRRLATTRASGGSRPSVQRMARGCFGGAMSIDWPLTGHATWLVARCWGLRYAASGCCGGEPERGKTEEQWRVNSKLILVLLQGQRCTSACACSARTSNGDGWDQTLSLQSIDCSHRRATCRFLHRREGRRVARWPRTLRRFEKIWLTDESIVLMQVTAVPPGEIQLRGVDSTYALLFPSQRHRERVQTSQTVSPIKTTNGTMRYWQPPHTSPHLYLPPLLSWQHVARHPTTELTITEGEKKAAAACQHGLITAAVGGVWCWRSTIENGEKLILPMLDEFQWTNRSVLMCPDSDAWHDGRDADPRRILRPRQRAAIARCHGPVCPVARSSRREGGPG